MEAPRWPRVIGAVAGVAALAFATEPMTSWPESGLESAAYVCEQEHNVVEEYEGESEDGSFTYYVCLIDNAPFRTGKLIPLDAPFDFYWRNAAWGLSMVLAGIGGAVTGRVLFEVAIEYRHRRHGDSHQ